MSSYIVVAKLFLSITIMNFSAHPRTQITIDTIWKWIFCLYEHWCCWWLMISLHKFYIYFHHNFHRFVLLRRGKSLKESSHNGTYSFWIMFHVGYAHLISFICKFGTVSSASLPLIVDMPGGGPAPPNERSSLLASHGFAVFRFNYFHSVLEALKQKEPKAYFDTRLFFVSIPSTRQQTKK